jgi:hypothetical protein
MQAMEPTPARAPLEVGIVVEVVCDDAARAETICHIAGKNLFYARLPDVKGTAGAAAIMSDDFVVFEPAHAIKFTIRRLRPSGSMGESDLFGSQQYAPLFGVEIP